jgi:hypothetical protein
MATAVGTVGLGASLAGGLLSAFGAEKSGQASQQMYNYQAQVARINSDIDKQNSAWTLSKGETEATQYGMKAAQQRGQIIASQGASGLDVNSGSNKRVQESQKTITDTDLAQIRANAGKTAYDFRTKSDMDLNQATLYEMAGRNAKSAGDLGALGSIIGTAGSVSSKWMQGNTAGLGGIFGGNKSGGVGFVSGL